MKYDLDKLKALALAPEIKPWQERMPEHVRQIGTAASEAPYKDLEIAELRAEVERLRADAERYRQLKEDDFTAEYCEYTSNRMNGFEEFDLDGVIDAAIEKEKA